MRGGSAVAGLLIPGSASCLRAVRPFGPWNPTSQSFRSKETRLSTLELLAGKRHLIVTLTYHPGIMLNVPPRACPGHIANYAELPLLQVGAER